MCNTPRRPKPPLLSFSLVLTPKPLTFHSQHSYLSIGTWPCRVEEGL